MTDDQSIGYLLGEDLDTDPLGADLAGASLISGYIPERSLVIVPPVQIGDGLAGPVNDQQLVIARDNRPLAVDELGKQGPFQLEIGKYARHRAGRQFPLNYQFGAGLDPSLPNGDVPLQDQLGPSVFGPQQDPENFEGFQPAEILPATRTVFNTASPNVGWSGY